MRRRGIDPDTTARMDRVAADATAAVLAMTSKYPGILKVHGQRTDAIAAVAHSTARHYDHREIAILLAVALDLLSARRPKAVVLTPERLAQVADYVTPEVSQ